MDLHQPFAAGEPGRVDRAGGCGQPTYHRGAQETGTAVLMPWLDKVGGVLEAWYAGSKGADAVASVLFGAVNPGAKLPMTFSPQRTRSAPSRSDKTTR